MSAPAPLVYRNLNLKLMIGRMRVNILYLNYEPPVPSWSYGVHSHSGYELHLVPRGKGQLIVAGKTFSLAPGSFYLTGPGVEHEQLADSADPMSEYCLNFEFRLQRSFRGSDETCVDKETDVLIRALLHHRFWFGQDRYGCGMLFEQMLRELQDRWVGHFTILQGLATHLLFNLVRSFEEPKRSEYAIPDKRLDDLRRFEADEFFLSCGDSLHPHQLADRMGVGVRQLNRIMLEYYGMSFREKLLQVRLQRVKRQLGESKRSLEEIAGECGLGSASHLCRVFKKRESVSPSQYRTERLSEIGAAADSKELT